MKHKNLIIFLFALVIVLAVVLWIVAAKFVSRQSVATPQSITLPSNTNKSIVSEITSKVEKMIESPASTRTAEEKARASEQFGAALERVGITTQAEPSR